MKAHLTEKQLWRIQWDILISITKDDGLWFLTVRPDWEMRLASSTGHIMVEENN